MPFTIRQPIIKSTIIQYKNNKTSRNIAKKAAAFATSFSFIILLGLGSAAVAAVTISNTGITGDSAFNSISGATSTVVDVGLGKTLSLQTGNNGPLTTGSGLFTVGGNINITGNATTTGLTIGGIAGGVQCLHASASGVISGTGSDCSGGSIWGSITGTLSAQADLQNALNAKQATLVSAGNIKTVNGTTLLGNGDLVISAGAGTVTSVSVSAANGISGSVATATTTPAITLTLGAITPTTVNGNTITTGTGILTLGAGKTLTVSNSLNLAGTDGKGIDVGAATSGKILIGNGTNMVLSTSTFPTAAGNSGNVLTSDGTNWLSSAPAGGGGSSQASIFSGGTLKQQAIECAVGTVSSTALNAAATNQDVTIQTGVSGNARWNQVLVSETTQFTGVTGLNVSMGRPGSNNYEMTGTLVPLMVSSGDTNSWTARPSPPQLTSSYNIVLGFSTVPMTTAGSVTVTNGSTAVTGAGTSFTAGMTGAFISIMGVEYGFTYVSATSGTLSSPYAALSGPGNAYVIQQHVNQLTAGAVTWELCGYLAR